MEDGAQTIMIIYPKDTNDLFRGTVYQVKDIITKEWSENKVISKTCYSTMDALQHLVDRKMIRIIKK
jgi:hypothetical protein